MQLRKTSTEECLQDECAATATGSPALVFSFRFSCPLPLDVKVDARRRAVFGDLLAINHHFKLRHSRPLHAAHGLRGFGNGILSGFGEALFGRTHNLDDFLGHGCLLSSNRSISLPKSERGAVNKTRIPWRFTKSVKSKVTTDFRFH